MTEIYLIRHTQAEGNRYRMMQGYWDGEVTALGLRQADALGRRFAKLPLDAVYSSDLTRAVLTAEAAACASQLPVQRREALRELNIGPWEQKFFGNLSYEEPELIRRFIYDAENWAVPGAETFAQVRERALAELRRIAVENDGKTVAVVSHGVAIRCILSGITGIPLSDTERLPICKNTAVTKLRFEDGEFHIEYINDDSHLGESERTVWNAVGALRDTVFDPKQDRSWYEQCYADAWTVAHGSLNGYSAATYYDAACRHHALRPGAVRLIYLEKEPAGLVDLDPERGSADGAGWISLLYLKDGYRGKGYGIQLLARAISFFHDRSRLQLQVAESNLPALAFYTREGFRTVSETKSPNGKLLVLERPLKHGTVYSGTSAAAPMPGGPDHA